MLASIYPNDFLYELVKWIHILVVVVGFGSTFVWPFLASRARATGDPGIMLHTTRISVQGGKTLTEPFIYAAGATGVILVLFGQMADFQYWKFSQAWVSIAFLLYIVGLVISLGFHTPNIKAMLALQEELAAGAPPAADGPPPQVAELEERGKKAAMFGGILHLLFALILIDMVFKPFL